MASGAPMPIAAKPPHLTETPSVPRPGRTRLRQPPARNLRHPPSTPRTGSRLRTTPPTPATRSSIKLAAAGTTGQTLGRCAPRPPWRRTEPRMPKAPRARTRAAATSYATKAPPARPQGRVPSTASRPQPLPGTRPSGSAPRTGSARKPPIQYHATSSPAAISKAKSHAPRDSRLGRSPVNRCTIASGRSASAIKHSVDSTSNAKPAIAGRPRRARCSAEGRCARQLPGTSKPTVAEIAQSPAPVPAKNR